MRNLSCLLMMILIASQVSADDDTKATTQSGDLKTDKQQTLIATAFGKPLYLEQITPADLEARRKEVAPGEFDEWLREYRGGRLYENIWREVRAKYVERGKIGVTDEEMAALSESVERRLKSMPQLPDDTTISPAMRKGVMVAWWRASLMDWKVCKSLYEKYGGRVGIGSLGAWIAFDAQTALLREHCQAGDIKFHSAEMEEAFWRRTRTKSFADGYPEGEELKQLFALPPYLQGQDTAGS